MSIVRPRRLVGVAALAAVGALLVAWSGAAAQSQPAAKAGALVKIHKTAFGPVLADARGHTLYLYGEDHKNASDCYGKCATFWPPLTTSGSPRAGAGAEASLLGVMTRKDGKQQVTYSGHPLYLFAQDKKAGQTNGEGIEKSWWVVSAAGKKVTKKPAPAPAPAPTPAPAGPPLVQLGSTSKGQVLVDSQGMSLYQFTKDTGSTSTCYDQCATAWPPLLVTSKLVVGPGLDQLLVGTTQRSDGSIQLTWAGRPLYHWFKDKNPGDITGENVGGVWFLVSATGDKV